MLLGSLNDDTTSVHEQAHVCVQLESSWNYWEH